MPARVKVEHFLHSKKPRKIIISLSRYFRWQRSQLCRWSFDAGFFTWPLAIASCVKYSARASGVNFHRAVALWVRFRLGRATAGWQPFGPWSTTAAGDGFIVDEKARLRMVSSFDLENTIPDWALCFRWDIVLRGREQTPLDNHEH